jgi:ribosome maturation factor RimP
MTDAELKAALATLAEPIAQSLGLSIWGLETAASGPRLLVRLFLDAPGGIIVDSLAKASRSLSVALEVEDIIPGPFVLEVSSPGLERRFFSPDQMTAYLGQEVDVTLWPKGAEARGRKLRGRLAAVEGERIVLDADGEASACEWSQVKKARLVSEILSPVKPKATAKTKAEAKARFAAVESEDDGEGAPGKKTASAKPKKKSRSSARGKA